MTTPERLRRRQRREEFLLVLVGIGMIVQSYYYEHERKDVLECVTQIQARDAQSTKSVRKASTDRFDALYDVLDQRLSPEKQYPVSDPRVQRAWEDFKIAHFAYNDAIKDNPTPNPKVCQ